MKRLLIIISFFAAVQSVARAQDIEITYQQFYNELEPYGRWISYPRYGYVWQPYFERPDNFTPYSSGGHWVYTEYGWTWVSDYEWGWAPFHYGRWLYDDYLGWVWIPGYDWAPAWVTWGSYGGNYGWAPLGPGISISAGMSWRPPRSNWWTFVPCNRFGGSDWNRYIVRNNTTVINRVTIINNIYTDRGRGGSRPAPWMRGPRREEVERISRRPVQPLAINTVQRPSPTRVQNNSIAMYRPAVNRRPQGTPIRPVRAEPLSAARPESRLPVHNNDRRDNNPGNNRPINRPSNSQPPPRPGNPATTPNRTDRPDHPYPPRPEQRPGNPRPEQRPVNPGSRPENRPGNPPPQQESKPPVQPGNRPESRPDRPMPEKPINRPSQPPAQPGNRPANPRPSHNQPANPNPNPAMPPVNRPGLPPTNRPAMPSPNRPANPPGHREQPHKETPPPRKD